MSSISLRLVKCSSCGYVWWTKSKKKWVTCPRCKRKTKSDIIGKGEGDFYVNMWFPSARNVAEVLRGLAEALDLAAGRFRSFKYVRDYFKPRLEMAAKDFKSGGFVSGWLAEKLAMLCGELGKIMGKTRNEAVFGICFGLLDFIYRFAWELFWRDDPFLKPINDRKLREYSRLVHHNPNEPVEIVETYIRGEGNDPAKA